MQFSSLLALAVASCSSTVFAKTGPITAAYVEVNSNSIDNTARYQLADGSNMFDIAIIFASNIKYNDTHATWFNNENVQAILDNAACEIKPLQEKGIKVLLSLLGGGAGVGISNFQTQADAEEFAKVAADQILTYGLDGIDLDDEYAQYGDNGTPSTNSDSVIWLIQALRKELPDKLITMYNYGPAANAVSQTSTNLQGLLDYVWNPNYGTFQAPSIPGLTKSNLAAAAVAIESTSLGTAQNLATNTVNQNYGVYLTYNLADGDQTSYVSGVAQSLYGQSVKYVDFNEDSCCSASY